MPRVKPQYIWPVTPGEPLEAERKLKQRITYKSGGKKFKESKPPVALPTGAGKVAYGNHTQIEREIKDERVRLGL